MECWDLLKLILVARARCKLIGWVQVDRMLGCWHASYELKLIGRVTYPHPPWQSFGHSAVLHSELQGPVNKGLGLGFRV